MANHFPACGLWPPGLAPPLESEWLPELVAEWCPELGPELANEIAVETVASTGSSCEL